jgi:glycerol kinase
VTNQRETTQIHPVCPRAGNRFIQPLSGNVAVPHPWWNATVPGLGHRDQQRTGLVLDAYFSATKVQWLLHNTPGPHARAAGPVSVWDGRHVVTL